MEENSTNLIQMKQQDISTLKEKLWLKNDKKCPLLGIEVPLEKMALDHIHKLKSEDASEQKGTIRDSIEFRANAMEGKITNNWKRYFGADENNHPISLPDFLRNLADYLEKGAYQDQEGNFYIHPNEKIKEPKVSKSNYNKLLKAYKKSGKKAKFPEYPTSGKLTIKLKKLFEEFNIQSFN